MLVFGMPSTRILTEEREQVPLSFLWRLGQSEIQSQRFAEGQETGRWCVSLYRLFEPQTASPIEATGQGSFQVHLPWATEDKAA